MFFKIIRIFTSNRMKMEHMAVLLETTPTMTFCSKGIVAYRLS